MKIPPTVLEIVIGVLLTAGLAAAGLAMGERPDTDDEKAARDALVSIMNAREGYVRDYNGPGSDIAALAPYLGATDIAAADAAPSTPTQAAPRPYRGYFFKVADAIGKSGLWGAVFAYPASYGGKTRRTYLLMPDGDLYWIDRGGAAPDGSVVPGAGWYRERNAYWRRGW